MATYMVSLGHSTPPEAAEAAEKAATDPFESWLGWLEEARDEIDQGDGDPDDVDNLLALALEHLVGGGPDAVALKEKRAEEVLREARDSSNKIAIVVGQQREARKQRAVEAAALAGRLDRIDNAVAAVTRENSSLRTTLENVEENLRQATAMLEKEIARERSLRRLLDAQRSRPNTQRVASELAKRRAAKALEVVTKSKTEAA